MFVISVSADAEKRFCSLLFSSEKINLSLLIFGIFIRKKTD